MNNTELILIVKIVEWAQKHKIRVEDLTSAQIKQALKH